LWRAALFPTLGLVFGAVEQIPLAAAVCRAYNNWLADYCQAYPDRLIGIGAVPIQEVEEAIREMRQVVKDLGFKGIFLRPNPHCGRNWESPIYDPFYAEAEALGVPLMFHKEIRERTGLSESAKRKILGENAARLYGLM
jgi:predicted TIM-barrel fold metal-dependent hydrolase